MAKEESLRYAPSHATPPGASLRSTLATLGMTQADLSARTGQRQHLPIEDLTRKPVDFWLSA